MRTHVSATTPLFEKILSAFTAEPSPYDQGETCRPILGWGPVLIQKPGLRVLDMATAFSVQFQMSLASSLTLMKT